MADWKDNPTMQKALAELGRDKKKAAILGILLVVCLVMGIRMFAGKGGPSSAAGSPLANSSGSPTTAVKAAPSLSTDADGKAKAKRDEYIKKMCGAVTRDLFVTDLSLFPLKHVEPAKVKPAPTTASAPAPSQEDLARKVLAEARSLVLESTVLGSSAVAIINGKVLHVGGYVGEFEVTEITAHSCVVRKKGISLTLEIRK